VILHDNIEEKSKFAGSAQENGPGSALLHSLLYGSDYLHLQKRV
jgi:hypothetical protein